MSRFSNLEFDGEKKGKVQGQKGSDHVLDQDKNEDYYLNLAEKHFRQGRFEEALRAYSRTLEVNRALADAWWGQVKMLIELEEYKEANLWADKALEKFSDHQGLIASKAVAQARMGNREKAVAFSDAALKEKGAGWYLWLSRGEVFMAAGHKNYEYTFQKALSEAEEEEKWWVEFLVGRVYLYYRKFARALQTMQKAAALEAGSPFLWSEIGKCQAALGLRTSAEFSFRQALDLDSGYQPAQKGLDSLQNTSFFHRIVDFFRRLRN